MEFPRSSCFATLLTLLVAACATTAPEVRLSERLDERTGVTVTTLDRPVEFFSPQMEQGLDAASFADLGLAETNNMGTRSYYLWLAVLWGRVDTNRLQSPKLASVVLDLGSGSLTFDSAKRVDPPGRTALYAPPAEWSEQLVFPLNVAEVREISHATVLTINVTTQTGEQRNFTLWKPPTESLPMFADELLEGTPPAR